MAQTEDADRRTIGLDRGSGSPPYWDFVEAQNVYDLGLELFGGADSHRSLADRRSYISEPVRIRC